MKPAKRSEPVTIPDPSKREEQIRRRAREIYEARGRSHVRHVNEEEEEELEEPEDEEEEDDEEEEGEDYSERQR